MVIQICHQSIVNNWVPLAGQQLVFITTIHFFKGLSHLLRKKLQHFGHNRNKKYHKTKNSDLVLITLKTLFSEKNMLPTAKLFAFLLKQHKKVTNDILTVIRTRICFLAQIFFRRPKMKMECYQICCCNFDYRACSFSSSRCKRTTHFIFQFLHK